ncbi:MAG TPA: DUF3300 domain-containing protein [Bryobacteraceae bacterium]|nr:DUF3300 domain-containing protein [Bryobacteraceae bacterium]
MKTKNLLLKCVPTIAFLALVSIGSARAQDPNQQQQYPPDQQQSAPPPQYPPQGRYPPAQQYPPQTQQYPQQGPPPQSQYPPPQYPQQGQYPPPSQGGQYPPAGYPPPQMLSPDQLRQVVGPIALYPDGLLAQVLTASTFSNQIPDAASWANQHQYLKGDALAQAIRADNLNFDPSIMALLPFPSVLDYMARYPAWTQALGNAVLSERDQVMDAVQQLRQEAYNYGYLQNDQYIRVNAAPGAIEILPVNPGFYYVPYYNPVVVFSRPRPGFFVGGAIRFGGGITIGASFAPWGWGGVGFGWHEHTILVDNHPWNRTWANRGYYAHPYAAPYHAVAGPRVEHHDYHDSHGHDAHGHDGHDHH